MAETGKKKVPGKSWNAWIFLWIIYACNANIREILNRVSPYIVEEYGVNATQLGLLSTAALGFLALGATPLGMWADRGGVGYKRKNRAFVLGAGYLLACFLCGIGPVSATYAVFFILNALRGFFSGAGEACEVGQMMEWAPREKTGFFAGLHHTGYPWGSLIGGFIVTAFLNIAGGENWKGVFFIFPIIGIITWLLWLRWANAKNYQRFQDQCAEGGYTSPMAGDSDVENYKAPPGLLKRCLKNPNILMMAIVSYCCLFGYAGINYWLTPYITFVGNYDPASAASLSVIFTITGGLGQVCWGMFADKFGTKRTLMICTLWLTVAFVLMQFAGASLGALIGLQLLMGFALNAVYAMIYKFDAVSSEKGGVVMANSLTVTGMYAGGASATFILGKIIDAAGGLHTASGYYTGLYVMSGVMLVAFFLVLLFTRETNGPKFKKDFSLVSLESCNLADVDDPNAVRTHEE